MSKQFLTGYSVNAHVPVSREGREVVFGGKLRVGNSQ